MKDRPVQSQPAGSHRCQPRLPSVRLLGLPTFVSTPSATLHHRIAHRLFGGCVSKPGGVEAAGGGAWLQPRLWVGRRRGAAPSVPSLSEALPGASNHCDDMAGYFLVAVALPLAELMLNLQAVAATPRVRFPPSSPLYHPGALLVSQCGGRCICAGMEHAHSRSMTVVTFQSSSTKMLFCCRSVRV